MAHTCPECGSLCHCNGDIDDIQWGEDSEESDQCVHWKECEGSEEDDNYRPPDDE